MNDFETLTVEEPREGVVLATLNRPEQLKAITFEMFDECEPLSEAARSFAEPSLRQGLAAVRDVEREEEDEEDENAFLSERRQTSVRGEDKP